MRILLSIKVVLLSLLLSTANISFAQDLIMSTAHWPPWVIIEDHEKSVHKTQSNNNQRFSGINIDIAKALAKKLGFNLILNSCSWSSCINLHKAGKSDILDSLLMRTARKEHMYFITPAYKKTSDKVVFIKQKSDIQISTYEDLYQLEKIGVTEATKYAPKFDSDNTLNKHSVASDMQLFAMLKRDRISAFIMDENIADYMLSHSQYAGLFKKSMRFNENRKNVYFALSKKSALVDDLPAFNHAMEEVLSGGFIETLVEKYTQ